MLRRQLLRRQHHRFESRLGQHQNGLGATYTRTRLPVRLVWCEQFKRADEAFRREKQIQNWGRTKRRALIELNYERLPSLSKNYTEHGPPDGSRQARPPGRA